MKKFLQNQWNRLKKAHRKRKQERARTRKQNKSFDPQTMAAKLAKLNFDKENNEFKGKRFYYWLRNIWGVLLALVLIVSITFQFWLTSEVGHDHLNFEKYPWLIQIVLSSNFVEIVGLCYVVVKFLFPPDNTPKTGA